MTKEQEAIILKAAEILVARNRERRAHRVVKLEPKREMSFAKEMFHNCTGGIFEDD